MAPDVAPGADSTAFPENEVAAVLNRPSDFHLPSGAFPARPGSQHASIPSVARPGSGSPIRQGTPIFPSIRTSSGSPPPVLHAHVRARTSSGSPPPLHGALWNGYLSGRIGRREERPTFERDSQRNRSLEGRPGSRKHKRWSRSVEITGSLRRAMAKCGEDPNISEAQVLELQAEVEFRPSAFYQLMENEGAHGALEALEAAEGAASRSRIPRQKDAAQLADEHERQVRRTFADTWQFIRGNDSACELLAKLEEEASRAFGPSQDEAIAMLWMLNWDGDVLDTKFGKPPANEMVIGGLNPTFRKVAHQLARSLGLHSESRVVDGPHGEQDNKVIALRPPRRHARKGDPDAWVQPLSVARVFTGA